MNRLQVIGGLKTFPTFQGLGRVSCLPIILLNVFDKQISILFPCKPNSTYSTNSKISHVRINLLYSTTLKISDDKTNGGSRSSSLSKITTPSSKGAKHNPLQRLAYLGISAMLLPIQMVTGLLYYLCISCGWPFQGNSVLP